VDLEILQSAVSDGDLRYGISVGSRCEPYLFLRGFRWTGMALNLDGEIQIIGGIAEALAGSLRILTKKLKDAFLIHIPIAVDTLTLSGTTVL
jgi:hypothetical protein